MWKTKAPFFDREHSDPWRWLHSRRGSIRVETKNSLIFSSAWGGARPWNLRSLNRSEIKEKETSYCTSPRCRSDRAWPVATENQTSKWRPVWTTSFEAYINRQTQTLTIPHIIGQAGQTSKFQTLPRLWNWFEVIAGSNQAYQCVDGRRCRHWRWYNV